MPRKPVLTPTAQTKKSKPSVSAKISRLKSLVGTEPEKIVTRGRQRKRTTPTKQMMKDGLIPLHAKEQKATVYEVNLTLIVTKRSKRMIAQLREKQVKQDVWEPSMDRTVTTEQIVDHLKAQIFIAGTAQILIKAESGEPSELVQGIDALDVELLCQFFGVAK